MNIDLLRRRFLMGLIPTDIIINRKWSDNDAALMDVIYAQGWSRSRNYMTQREANKVTGIGNAFMGNTLITDFSVLKYFNNQSFTAISRYAFQECTSLEVIQFPEQVIQIGSGAGSGGGTFYNCTSLYKVVLPPNLSLLQGRVFQGCSSLKFVQLPESVTNLYQAFWGSYIEEITIPRTITKIQNATFWECKKLKKINLTNSTTSDDNNSFRNSPLSKNIYYEGTIKEWYKSRFGSTEGLLSYGFTLYINGNPLPKTITIDEDMSCVMAFYGQKTIEKVEIQGNPTLSYNCFSYTTNLKEIVLSSELLSIPSGAFKNCTSLKTISPLNNIKYIYGEYSMGAFQNCSSLETEIILTNVISIGDSTFWNCSKIPRIVIGDLCTTIEGNVFGGCSGLKRIEIGTGITSIGNNSLFCVSANIIIKAQNPPTIESDTFKEYTGYIYVPDSAVDLYKSAWSGLNIKPISELP